MTIDDGSIEGHLYLTIHALCVEGAAAEVSTYASRRRSAKILISGQVDACVKNLLDSINSRESRNNALKLRVSQLLSRCATGRQDLVKQAK